MVKKIQIISGAHCTPVARKFPLFLKVVKLQKIFYLLFLYPVLLQKLFYFMEYLFRSSSTKYAHAVQF